MVEIAKTGIDWIDDEHTIIYEMFSIVRSQALRGRWRGAKATYKDLVKSLQIHFAKEEALMLRLLYPDADTHMEAHGRLLADLACLYSHLNGRTEVRMLVNLIEGLERRGLDMIQDDIRLAACAVRNGDTGA